MLASLTRLRPALYRRSALP